MPASASHRATVIRDLRRRRPGSASSVVADPPSRRRTLSPVTRTPPSSTRPRASTPSVISTLGRALTRDRTTDSSSGAGRPDQLRLGVVQPQVVAGDVEADLADVQQVGAVGPQVVGEPGQQRGQLPQARRQQDVAVPARGTPVRGRPSGGSASRSITVTRSNRSASAAAVGNPARLAPTTMACRPVWGPAVTSSRLAGRRRHTVPTPTLMAVCRTASGAPSARSRSIPSSTCVTSATWSVVRSATAAAPSGLLFVTMSHR